MPRLSGLRVWLWSGLLVGSLAVTGCGQTVVHAMPAAAVVDARQASVSVARIAVVGDIACDPASADYNGGRGTSTTCKQRAVGRLVRSLAPDALVTTGDNQYEKGSLKAYRTSYDSALGSLRPITWAVPGNHEYGTPKAAGYFTYFGARAGTPSRPWRSFSPAKGWQVLLLDSNCWAVGGCGRHSPQARWLHRRVSHHPARCTIASWHHPLHTAGHYKGDSSVEAVARPLWRAADRNGVDIVVNGHDHNYQRFAPINRMVEFVAGTGGKSHYGLSNAKHLRFGTDASYGVLLLTLHADGTYRHAFMTIDGRRLDVGTGRCLNRPR
ncbi:MAG: metallophosphoesterase [Actinomycetes bacterium]